MSNSNTQQKKLKPWAIALIVVFSTLTFLSIMSALLAYINYKQVENYYFWQDMGMANTLTSPEIFFRRANSKDITVTEEELSFDAMGERLTFTANKNIDDLKISFYFNNKNGDFIKSIKREIGDVKKGQQYTVTIGITDILGNYSINDLIGITGTYYVSGITSTLPI